MTDQCVYGTYGDSFPILWNHQNPYCHLWVWCQLYRPKGNPTYWKFVVSLSYWTAMWCIGNWYAVDALWEDTHWWKAQCQSEVWFVWQSHFEGQCAGDLDWFFYHVIWCCHTSLLLQFCLLIYLYLILQLTNEPHMSHGMVNFDYKVVKSWKIYDLAHFYFIMIWYICLELWPRSGTFFLSKLVYGNTAKNNLFRNKILPFLCAS